MKYLIIISIFFCQFLLTSKGDDIVSYSISPDTEKEVLCWTKYFVAIFRQKQIILGQANAIEKKYYIGTARYDKEPELACQTNFPSTEIFINHAEKIYYDSAYEIFIGRGLENKSYTEKDFNKWEGVQYFLLIMKPLKVEFFKTRPELDKKLEEMGYKKNVTLMDIGKFFDEMKKIAKEID